MKITSKTSRLELAAIVTQHLNSKNINAVLVGGAVVSLYTKNEYESRDLDFISPSDHKQITTAMAEIGFTPTGKNFLHSETPLTVEFPSGPIGIGDRVPIKPEGKIQFEDTTIILLSPTQSVMDRLAWFYYNNDRQCLDQALLVTKHQPVNINEIQKWSIEEGNEIKFNLFLNKLRLK